jgi:hypothetical protein
MCREGMVFNSCEFYPWWLSFDMSYMSYMNSKAIHILLFCLLLQGVNPWIEVDGGVTPKNAYKVSSLNLFFLW